MVSVQILWFSSFLLLPLNNASYLFYHLLAIGAGWNEPETRVCGPSTIDVPTCSLPDPYTCAGSAINCKSPVNLYFKDWLMFYNGHFYTTSAWSANSVGIAAHTTKFVHLFNIWCNGNCRDIYFEIRQLDGEYWDVLILTKIKFDTGLSLVRGSTSVWEKMHICTNSNTSNSTTH